MKPNCDDCNYEMTETCSNCKKFSKFVPTKTAIKRYNEKYGKKIMMYQDRIGDTKHKNLESAQEHIKDIIKDELAIYIYNSQDDFENGEPNETHIVDTSSIKFIKKK